MTIADAHKHSQAILRWYMLEEPLLIINGTLAYARAFMEIVPLPFLFLTLLKPWKNIREKKREHGFDLKAASERPVLNILSRAVGAVLRSIAMIFGVLAHIVLFTGGAVYLILWYLYPFISIAVLIILLRSL